MRGFVALFLALAFLCVAQDAFELDGTWSFHTWSGYQPPPQKTMADGVLSIREVKGPYGFALQSSVKPDAKAGDTVTFTARARGKGNLRLRLHNLDGQGKWIEVSKHGAGEALEADWREYSLTVMVDNVGRRMTEKVLVTVGAGKEAELDLRDAKVVVDHTAYVGDAFFPQHWLVFAGVPNGETPPLETVPEEIAGIKGMTVKMENNAIEFAPMFPTPKHRNCAWLYGKIVADAPGEYAIGAGADYYLALHVNGDKVIDTLKSGDGADIPHFTNHIGTAMLRKGENIVAVKFETGTGHNPLISLAGAGDLRNLSAIINITERNFFDDFETKRERSGNPELVRRIFTEGMDNLTTQAIYRKGVFISDDGKRHELPAKSGGKMFATGLRLYEFNGAGSLDFRIGGDVVLSIARPRDKGDLHAVLTKGERTLKGMALPLAMLPADIIVAVGHNNYAVNAVSIQNSRLVSMAGTEDFSTLHDFDTAVAVNTEAVRIDDYFTGIGIPERNDNSIPFKIDLAAEFDPVKAGWKLIFNDEFDGDSLDWKNNWTTSPWSKETDRNKDMVSVRDGMAHFACEWFDKEGKVAGRTISAYSRRRFGYGYYEARVRFTRKPGCWAAFWMHDEGRNLQLGGGFEIDIFEDYPTRGGKPVVASNLHATRGSQTNSYGYHFDLPKTLDDFYLIGCKWTPFEISTYIDGRLVKSVSRHSPWQSVTYDAFNHGFGTNSLYVCIGLCHGTTGGKGVIGEREEFLVDWVRGYEYPTANNPQVRWQVIPSKSAFAKGEEFTLAADSTEAGVAYLFDNGYLIDYKREPPYTFTLAVDERHYKDTAWSHAGRSGKKMKLDRYPHIYRIAVQEKEGRVGFTDVFPVFVDMQYGEPWKGVAQVIPGSVNPAAYNTGGHNVSNYKQSPTPIPDGKECFSRGKLNLREAGEYVNIAVDVKEGRAYCVTMPRRPYPEDLRWPVRAMLLVDGVYAGDLKADSNVKEAVLENVVLKPGRRNLTLVSACSYGVWPEELVFE